MDEAGIVRSSVPARRAAFVRQVRSSDLSALHVLDKEVFGEFAYPLFVLRQFMDVHSRHFLVLDADPPLRGYLLAAYAAQTREAWLLGIGVQSEFRAHGYGRLLLDRSLCKLHADGAQRVRLTVKPENDSAIGLYESMNFRKMSFEPHYYGDGEDRFEMVLPSLDEYMSRRGDG
jgi:ribosomal protein S18 acetylase RimI-like enzyme